MANRPMFFESVKHHGVGMNKYGVTLAKRSHPAAETEFWPRDWEYVPLKNGNLDLKSAVENEAYDAGYRYRWIGDYERLWSKPKVMVTS